MTLGKTTAAGLDAEPMKRSALASLLKALVE
jgi:hypothetical protein